MRNTLVGKTRKIGFKCNTKKTLYINGEIEFMGRINIGFYIKKLCFHNLSECSEGIHRHSDKLDIINRMSLDCQKAFDFETYCPKAL